MNKLKIFQYRSDRKTLRGSGLQRR